MTTLRTAAQQALEALEWFNRYGSEEHGPSLRGAEHALRTALAEPEHETIARLRRLRAEAEAEHRQALEQGKCSSCGQELPEELKTQYLVNHDLPIGCDHCNHPLWCGTKCKSCGRKA